MTPDEKNRMVKSTGLATAAFILISFAIYFGCVAVDVPPLAVYFPYVFIFLVASAAVFAILMRSLQRWTWGAAFSFTILAFILTLIHFFIWSTTYASASV